MAGLLAGLRTGGGGTPGPFLGIGGGTLCLILFYSFVWLFFECSIF